MLKYTFPCKTTRITDDYEITDIALGTGISGNVLQCIKKSSGERYALKIIGNDPRACREIDLHYRARDCPNIVKIFGIYENRNRDTGLTHLLLILECMEGGELFSRIQNHFQHGFTEKDAACLVHQICTAIAYLHRLNIAHRDLKPENLLFSSNDNNAVLKLIDFGFAKETLPGQPLVSPCFTPYYVAPEVIGRKSYDKRCDLWSLGVITYILLCGYPPFYSHGDTPISPGMKSRISNGQYTFPPNEWNAVSDDAKNLIQRLLIVEPERRLTIEQVMQHRWIRRYQDAPQTPLCTTSLLSNNKTIWDNVNEGFREGLETMRTESSVPQLKNLAIASNDLYKRRRDKAKVTAMHT